MKIRIKKIESDKLIYQIDDENGKQAEVDFTLFESALRILDSASKNTTIKYAKSFEKFISNLRSATRYYDIVKKENDKEKINIYNVEKFSKKAIKYDKRAQALFTIHRGWYENFIFIALEIEKLLQENYKHLESEIDLTYTANRISSILGKYKNKQKTKTL